MEKTDRRCEREAREEPPTLAGKRSRLEQVHLNSAMDADSAQQHTQAWDPPLKETWGADVTPGAPSDGVDVDSGSPL